MKQKMPFRMVKHLLFLVVLSIGLCGCEPSVSTDRQITDFTEAAVNSGNLLQRGSFAETKESLYFTMSGLLFRLDKATLEISLNCDVPGCTHGDSLCPAYYMTDQTFFVLDNKLYFVEDGSPECLYELNGTAKRLIGTLNRQPDIYKRNYLYKDRVYAFTETGSLSVADLESGETVAEYPDAFPYITGFFIQDDIIYFININQELITMGIDGSNRRVLEGDKATRVMEYRDRLYYIRAGGELPLISMDKEAGDKQTLLTEMLVYNIAENHIFYGKLTESGLFVAELDGSESRKICDKSIIDIFYAEQWGKVIVTLSSNQVLLMDTDGSNMQEFALPLSDQNELLV